MSKYAGVPAAKFFSSVLKKLVEDIMLDENYAPPDHSSITKTSLRRAPASESQIERVLLCALKPHPGAVPTATGQPVSLIL